MVLLFQMSISSSVFMLLTADDNSLKDTVNHMSSRHFVLLSSDSRLLHEPDEYQ